MSVLSKLSLNGLQATIFFVEGEYPISGRHADIHEVAVQFDGEDSATHIVSHPLAAKVLRCVLTHKEHIDRATEILLHDLRDAWAPLKHKHICPLIDIVTTGDGLPAVIVPFYELGNIADYNRRHPSANKLQQILQAAEAVIYLHQRGVWHGGLYATNLMMEEDADGVGVRITDPSESFLIYLLEHPNHHTVPTTWRHKSDHELMGHAINDKTDIYQFACLMYEIYVGKKPFHNVHLTRGVSIIMAHGHLALPKPPCIDDQIWVIMQECWAPTPAHRPPMVAVEARLRALL